MPHIIFLQISFSKHCSVLCQVRYMLGQVRLGIGQVRFEQEGQYIDISGQVRFDCISPTKNIISRISFSNHCSVPGQVWQGQVRLGIGQVRLVRFGLNRQVSILISQVRLVLIAYAPRLGSVRLGQVWLGQVRFDCIRPTKNIFFGMSFSKHCSVLCQVRLGICQVRLGQVQVRFEQEGYYIDILGQIRFDCICPTRNIILRMSFSKHCLVPGQVRLGIGQVRFEQEGQYIDILGQIRFDCIRPTKNIISRISFSEHCLVPGQVRFEKEGQYIDFLGQVRFDCIHPTKNIVL